MHERHLNRELYFNEQKRITEQIILPYISACFPITSDSEILEVGCSDAGNLYPFLEIGCKVTGIDISEIRIKNALRIYGDHPSKNKLNLIAKDILFSIMLPLIVFRSLVVIFHVYEYT